MVDDGTLPGGFASAPCDDEGVVHRRHALVDQGVVNGFVYDLKTAAQSGVSSTGNGTRDLFSPPSPGMSNLLVEGGQRSAVDLLAGVKDGLWVERVLGLGQGNILSGSFSNPVSLAYRIVGGEIVGRVKDAAIAGNSYELLQDVDGLSCDTEWVYSTHNLPHVLLPDVSVAAHG